MIKMRRIVKLKIEDYSATKLGRMVQDGYIKPTQIIEYTKDRIKERNPSLNAFVYSRIEEAYRKAEELEKRLKAGEHVGPFAGVPFALKDFLSSKKGWTHSYGGVKSLIKEDLYDSVFCSAMEKAGGIAVGKTNSPTYGFRGLCDNKLYGPSRNPFNTAFNTGGSSGGSAAAVADKLVPIAEGGDAGGSIRIPAAWCNCFGFKASAGVIPSVCRPDAWAATHPFCCNGGITRTVEDSAVLLNYMCGYNPRDPFSYPRESRIDFKQEMKRSVRGWKVAYTLDFDIFPVDPEVARIFKDSLNVLKEAGCEVQEVHFNFKSTANKLAETWCRSICIDTAIEMELLKKENPEFFNRIQEEFPEEFIRWNKDVSTCNILDYYNINLIRTEILDALQDIFDQYSIIVSPTTACLPVLNSTDFNTLGPEEINGEKVERLIGFAETFLFNFTGNPAASIPIGLSKNKLPVGMQIIGRRFEDGNVFAISGEIERLKPWNNAYLIPQSREINRKC